MLHIYFVFQKEFIFPQEISCEFFFNQKDLRVAHKARWVCVGVTGAPWFILDGRWRKKIEAFCVKTKWFTFKLKKDLSKRRNDAFPSDLLTLLHNSHTPRGSSTLSAQNVLADKEESYAHLKNFAPIVWQFKMWFNPFFWWFRRECAKKSLWWAFCH